MCDSLQGISNCTPVICLYHPDFPLLPDHCRDCRHRCRSNHSAVILRGCFGAGVYRSADVTDHVADLVVGDVPDPVVEGGPDLVVATGLGSVVIDLAISIADVVSSDSGCLLPPAADVSATFGACGLRELQPVGHCCVIAPSLAVGSLTAGESETILQTSG